MAENIGLAQMAIAYSLILLVFVLATANRLKINRDLAIAALRMTLQLVAAGILLRYVFRINYWYTSLLLLFAMLFFAVHVVIGRLDLKIPRLTTILFVSMAGGSLVVIAVFIFLVVGRQPWYDAQYVIPIGGMIIGNSMTACALASERFTNEMMTRRQLIETSLALGANFKEASVDAFRGAYRAALLPTIASMTGMGIVHLPGMMTGQILSGVEPLLAVKYQIAIILAIIGAAALSCLLNLYLLRNTLFDRCHQVMYSS